AALEKTGPTQGERYNALEAHATTARPEYPSSLRGCAGGELEDPEIASLHTRIRQHTTSAQDAVHTRQAVVRNGHDEVMLEVVVHVVGRNEETLPPACQGGARVAQRIVWVGNHRVLGD